MYLKCQRPINPKFSLCQLPVRANSKNKTEDLHSAKSVQIRIFFLNRTDYGVFGHFCAVFGRFCTQCWFIEDQFYFLN